VAAENLRNAKGRGFCVWCIEIIKPSHSAYQVCEHCIVFERGAYLHGNCVIHGKCCENCKRLPYLIKERRVQ